MELQSAAAAARTGRNEIPDTIAFVMRIRREVFPMLDPDVLPPDLLDFEAHYIDSSSGAFFTVTHINEGVIGSIGVQCYDNRIAEIKDCFAPGTAAEILKCYVDPRFRREGIGSMLVREALDFVRAAGYETAYLHTHRFLPGAVSFWQRQGFTVIQETWDSWETVHMQRKA